MEPLKVLTEQGFQPSVIDGWGVIIPASYRIGEWIAQDDEVQELGRRYGGLYILATDENKTYRVDTIGELTPLLDSEAQVMPEQQGYNTIELSQFTLTPLLFDAISRAMDDRGLAFGMNRVIQGGNGYDGEIIAMSQAQSTHCMQGYTAKSVLNYKRSEFMWLPDLDEINQSWTQQLTANDPSSTIELSYRSYDPRLGIENTEQWKRYTNVYRLVDDGMGIYHICYTQGSEECSRPISISV